MPKYLIVNADDYGRTPSISAGIRQAHLHGIVTTTTAMMNFSTAQEDLREAMAGCPRLGLGVHLVLTAGHSLLPPEQVSSLVTEGSFPKLDRLEPMAAQINPIELRAEWRAQIEKFLATGATLDHLDSHHHASYLNETIFGVMLDLTVEYRVPIRSPLDSASGSAAGHVNRLLRQTPTKLPDHFIASFYDAGATLANLLNLLQALPDGLTEIMSHPGFVDEEILRDSSYNRQRESEIAILTSAEVRQAVTDNGITLSTFRDVL